MTKSTAPAANPVTDELLSEFDRLVGDGATLPLDTLKDRYTASSYFRFRDHEIYDVLLEMPITVHMLTSGTTDPVSRIIAALKEIHGDVLLIDLNSDGSTPKLRVRMWREEKALRTAWKAFAEAEYKSNLKAAGSRVPVTAGTAVAS